MSLSVSTNPAVFFNIVQNAFNLLPPHLLQGEWNNVFYIVDLQVRVARSSWRRKSSPWSPKECVSTALSLLLSCFQITGELKSISLFGGKLLHKQLVIKIQCLLEFLGGWYSSQVRFYIQQDSYLQIKSSSGVLHWYPTKHFEIIPKSNRCL